MNKRHERPKVTPETLLEKIHGPADRSFTAPISEIREELAEDGIDVSDVFTRVQARVAEINRTKPGIVRAPAVTPSLSVASPIRRLTEWWRGIVTAKSFQFASASAVLMLVLVGWLTYSRLTVVGPRFIPSQATADGTRSSGMLGGSEHGVRKLYLRRIDGDKQLYEDISGALKKALGAQSGISIVGAEDSDAQLEIDAQFVTPDDRELIRITVRMVKPGPQPFWPSQPGVYEYKGARRKVLAALIQNLIDALNAQTSNN